MKWINSFMLSVLTLMLFSCGNSEQNGGGDNKPEKLRLIIDTDANNELDDQHALAYAFFNQDVFQIEGITINNTQNGEGIDGHYTEAVRVAKLCGVYSDIPIIMGAEGEFNRIQAFLTEHNFDGKPAVDFIIEKANEEHECKLVLLAIGKLTNVALALQKAPEIASKVKVVWLGSNFPAKGEYNLDNDTSAVNPVIESGVEFEMVTVRYADDTGTTFVRVSPSEINKKMQHKGPKVEEAVVGRHGGEFYCFGDYSVDLFSHAKMYGHKHQRSLFDMAAVAILKNPEWAERKSIPVPKLIGNAWELQPNNDNEIVIWENFNRDAIVEDLFKTMDNVE